MIFHTPKGFKCLASCMKRAERFGKEGKITKDHALSAAYFNHKLMMGDNPLDDLVALDWFASKVDKWAESNLIDSDPIVHAMLYEWKKTVFIDPAKMI